MRLRGTLRSLKFSHEYPETGHLRPVECLTIGGLDGAFTGAALDRGNWLPGLGGCFDFPFVWADWRKAHIEQDENPFLRLRPPSLGKRQYPPMSILCQVQENKQFRVTR